VSAAHATGQPTPDPSRPIGPRRHVASTRPGHGRRWLIAATALLTIAGLTACGSSGEPSGNHGTGGTNLDAGDFPITVTTRYGDITIKKAPQRVVALTVASADALISLGVTPIAVAADPDQLASAFPWMVDSIKSISSTKLVSPSGVPSAEAIGQLHPDLIVGETWLFQDKAAYDQVNDVAPTVIPNDTALNVNWDKRLLNVAEALGQTDAANKLIADIHAEFAKVGEQVPGIAERTYQWVRVDPDGYGFGNGSVLELFGLTAAPNQDNTQNGPPLSKENTSQLNADLLGVWAPTDDLRKALDKDPLFQNLPAVKNGTVFYADLAMADAANSPGPMALRWLKDKIAPMIAALG
jgi:iron complex transport system substrate-binding protein